MPFAPLEVELEDMDYDAAEDMWTYPCPCGDIFQIFREDLEEGKEAAYCPSCTLVLRVIYDKDEYREDGDDAAEEGGNISPAASTQTTEAADATCDVPGRTVLEAGSVKDDVAT